MPTYKFSVFRKIINHLPFCVEAPDLVTAKTWADANLFDHTADACGHVAVIECNDVVYTGKTEDPPDVVLDSDGNDTAVGEMAIEPAPESLEMTKPVVKRGIWLLTAIDAVGYDSFDSFVVVAKNEEEARRSTTCADECRRSYGRAAHACFWHDPKTAKAVLVGYATDDAEDGLVMSSFRAG